MKASIQRGAINRDWIVGLLIVVVLALLGWWVAANTEWREITTPLPLKGEARTDPFYAAGKLVEGLGARAVKPQGFDRLPPASAVLVLTSDYWNLFPERRAQLKTWVESGGRLVLPETLIDEDEDLGPWIGVESQFHPQEKKKADSKKRDEDDDSAEKAGAAEPKPAPVPPPASPPASPDQSDAKKVTRRCPLYTEKPSAADAAARAAAQALPPLTAYRVCGLRPRHSLKALGDARVLWSIDSRFGPVALRVAVGRGNVTVLTGSAALQWKALLDADNARFLVALTQLVAGDEVWFVSDEDAENLAVLMWRFGWPVIVLTIAVLALLLWRAMTRFGPVAAVPPVARRSLAEQIRGSAEFVIRHRRGTVLLAAQVRALNEAAQRAVRGWSALDARAQHKALARVAQVEPAAITHALQLPRTATAHDFAQAIALLETVRRRLLAPVPISAGGLRADE